eukprot:GGOE01024268.1.p1 GENE.GGOE01024268.1~~GGOE01024268.1.p1  ORF type:complete len:751 (+),score=70.73 GGOE01024268.1:186-2438(+)
MGLGPEVPEMKKKEKKHHRLHLVKKVSRTVVIKPQYRRQTTLHKSFKLVLRQGLAVRHLQRTTQDKPGTQGSINSGAPVKSSPKDLTLNFSSINAQEQFEVRVARSERPSVLKIEQQLVEVTYPRQGEGSRVQLRSILVESSHREMKAGARSVSFSPEPPEVHVVDISADEWRGKRLALHHIAQHVEQHMRDWSIERYGMIPQQTDQRSQVENVDQAMCLACGAPAEAVAKDGAGPQGGGRWSDSLAEEMDFSVPVLPQFTTDGSAVAHRSPLKQDTEEVQCREGFEYTPQSPTLAQEITPAAAPAIMVADSDEGLPCPPGRRSWMAFVGSSSNRWSEGGFEGEMDFSLSPLSPQPPHKDDGSPEFAPRGPAVMLSGRQFGDASHLTPPGEESSMEETNGDKRDPEETGANCPAVLGEVTGASMANPVKKDTCTVGHRGRTWRVGVRASASRWSDGLDEEMDFSRPLFLPSSADGTTPGQAGPTGASPPSSPGQAKEPSMRPRVAVDVDQGDGTLPSTSGSPTVGRVSRQWSAEVKLSTTLWGENCDADFSAAESEVVEGSLLGPSNGAKGHGDGQGVKGPVENTQHPVEAMKAPFTVGRKGKQWTEQVRTLSSRWADGLDEEMDFSLPVGSALKPLRNCAEGPDSSGDMPPVVGAVHAPERIPQHLCGSWPSRRPCEPDSLSLPPVRPPLDHDIAHPHPGEPCLTGTYSPCTRPPTHPLPHLSGLMYSPCRSTWTEEVITRHRPPPAIS